MRSAFAALLMSSMMMSAAVEGDAKSPVRVVSYESLQCGDCTAYRTMLDEQLLPRYGDRVAFEHRDFPLRKHAWARPAAIAARHFDAVSASLGTEFRRWALNHIKTITPETFEQQLAQWARQHGQSAEAAIKALQNTDLARAVEEDFQDGIARGISKTPTVLVNGEPYVESFTMEELSNAIDAALAATTQK